MRRKLFSMIDADDINNKAADVYDFFMMTTIIVSIIPLAFKPNEYKNLTEFFQWIDYISVGIFILDYIFRLITADFVLKKSTASFFLYPLTPMAVIDLLSILPSLTVLHSGFKLLRLFRLMRAMKVIRVFKFLRYSKSFDIITNVFRRQKRVLTAVATMTVAYILTSALVLYNVEPDLFVNFFDAVYWATVSLTTIGYGDICPVSVIGRAVTMISSVVGIAIIALPSGVITAGYLEEINKKEKK